MNVLELLKGAFQKMNYLYDFIFFTDMKPLLHAGIFGPDIQSNIAFSFFSFAEKNDTGLSTSDIIATLALLISIIMSSYSIYQNKQTSQKTITEAFWMREILIPKFLTPFFSFIQESPEQYKSTVLIQNQGLGIFYSNYALSEMNKIRDSSQLLSISSKKLGAKIKIHVEDFENDIMQVNSYEQYIDTLTKFATNVIADIQKAQMVA